MTCILFYLQSLKYKTQIKEIMKVSDYTFEDLKDSLSIMKSEGLLKAQSLESIND